MLKKIFIFLLICIVKQNYSIVYEFYNSTKFDIDYKLMNRHCINQHGTIRPKETKKIEWLNPLCEQSCIDFIRFTWVDANGKKGCQEFNILGKIGCQNLMGNEKIKITLSFRKNSLTLNKSRKYFEPRECD